MASSAFRNQTPGSAYAATGLGAIGGPKGTAAAVVKMLFELVTQYDAEGLKKLQNDLKSLQIDQLNHESRLAEYEKNRATLQEQVRRGVQLINSERDVGDKDANKAFKEQIAQLRVLDAEISEIAGNEKKSYGTRKAQIAPLQAQRDVILDTLAASRRINREELAAGTSQLTLGLQILGLNDKIFERKGKLLAVNKQIATVEELIAKLQSVKADFLPKVGGVLLGALSSITVGALFGVGFQAAQDTIDKVTESIQNLIDPTERARKAIKDLGQEVADLASSKNISQLQAAQETIAKFGAFGGPTLPGGIVNPVTADILAAATAIQTLRQNFESYQQAYVATRGTDEQRKKLIDDLTASLLSQDEVYKKLLETRTSDQKTQLDPDEHKANADAIAAEEAAVRDSVTAVVDKTLADTAAKKAADDLAESQKKAFDDIQLDNARKQIEDIRDALISAAEATSQIHIDAIGKALDIQLANIDTTLTNVTASINEIHDRNIAGFQAQLDALKVVPSARTNRLQSQLDALGNAGPSQRTNALAAAIERLNAAEARRGYIESLNDIKDQRRLLVLEHELAARKSQINIYRYQGQARLIAIDAETARLQKQADAQDKLNQLLDLQFRAQQKIRRNEGEAIQDFLARRAQENRQLLTEQANLTRQSRLDSLNKAKEATQYRISLRQLEAQKVELIRKHNLDRELADLEKQLQASQDADQAALESKRTSLQKQLELSKQHDQDVYDSKKKALQDSIQAEQDAAKKEIAAAQETAKKNKEIAQKTADDGIAAEKRLEQGKVDAANDGAKKALAIFDKAEIDKMVLALQYAKSQQQLASLAGGAVGSAFAYTDLQSLIGPLDLPASLTTTILANARTLQTAYLAALNSIRIPHHAEGAVFPVTNAMNFGSNMIAGERGTELGVILSNRVARALKDSRSQLSMDISIYPQEDPYAADYRLRQTIREVVREELN